jgi:hypothetical protein
VAEEAKGAEVVESALAAAFGDREDVVGVPEGAAGGDRLEAVEAQAGEAARATGLFESSVDGDGVDAADGADSVVAREDLVTEIAGVGAETPLVDAVVGAEGTAAAGEDLEIAPAAEREAVGAGGELGAASEAAAGKGTGRVHRGLS